jgi:symplekin
MDKAVADEKRRKAIAAALPPPIDGKKRLPEEPAGGDAKRAKLDNTKSATTLAGLANFDFTSLNASLITELIVANLQAFSEADLLRLVDLYRDSRGLIKPEPAGASRPPSQPILITPPPTSTETNRSQTPPQSIPAKPAVPDEPQDPLQMDIDQDEMEYEPDRLNEEVRVEP